MYLEARLRTYNCPWYDEKEKKKKEVKINEKIRTLFPEMFKTDNLNYVQVTFETGYWRKANAIHNWFVENVQDGNDDCKDYWVDRETLKELKNLCEEVIKKSVLEEGTVENGYTFKNGKTVPILEKGKVIKNPEIAQDLLPSASGFFFGSTNYDGWYIEDLKRTVEIIDKCLALPEEWDFYYTSSW